MNYHSSVLLSISNDIMVKKEEKLYSQRLQIKKDGYLPSFSLFEASSLGCC